MAELSKIDNDAKPLHHQLILESVQVAHWLFGKQTDATLEELAVELAVGFTPPVRPTRIMTLALPLDGQPLPPARSLYSRIPSCPNQPEAGLLHPEDHQKCGKSVEKRDYFWPPTLTDTYSRNSITLQAARPRLQHQPRLYQDSLDLGRIASLSRAREKGHRHPRDNLVLPRAGRPRSRRGMPVYSSLYKRAARAL